MRVVFVHVSLWKTLTRMIQNGGEPRAEADAGHALVLCKSTELKPERLSLNVSTLFSTQKKGFYYV